MTDEIKEIIRILNDEVDECKQNFIDYGGDYERGCYANAKYTLEKVKAFVKKKEKESKK